MHVLGLWEETGVNPRSERGTATRDLRAVRRQDWIVTIEMFDFFLSQQFYCAISFSVNIFHPITALPSLYTCSSPAGLRVIIPKGKEPFPAGRLKSPPIVAVPVHQFGPEVGSRLS